MTKLFYKEEKSKTKFKKVVLPKKGFTELGDCSCQKRNFFKKIKKKLSVTKRFFICSNVFTMHCSNKTHN